MSTEELRAIQLLSRVPYGRLATSMRALPFLAVARHVLVDGKVLLRMHAGLGYHEACNGSVVAYGTDNFNAADGDENGWSVQFTGPAEIVDPTPEQRALFGRGPSEVNGEPFEPVFLRVEPHFVTVTHLDFSTARQLDDAA
ncbi:pyridoxamine 5'-phosphate oxidase family protein [Streptomyces sp. NPDC050504]|uniref:pyridoxamine 5'-phosphate oxidase family protein n=1 Tax=Streptomyces sp. NPDC050504 TaxID=3365618 RepID=UPI003795F90F